MGIGGEVQLSQKSDYRVEMSTDSRFVKLYSNGNEVA